MSGVRRGGEPRHQAARVRSCGWLVIVLWAGAAAAAVAGSAPAAAGGYRAVVEALWETVRREYHPRALAERALTAAARERLDAQARRAADLYALAPVLDRFVKRLGRSHAGFYMDRSVDFYLYRSMFTTRSLDAPALWHAGVQHRRTADGWVVREVWDGSPAARAGLHRGDLLLGADGAPYHPFAAFNDAGGAPVTLTIRRAGGEHTATLAPVHENPNRALLRALQRSVRIVEADSERIGYLHLWAATHPDMLAAYLAALEQLAGCDALILDLRGGFGGAWYEYLDPFFLDRHGYFRATVRSNRGEQALPVGQRAPVPYFPQPLVVLIDEGTRSGKEALAFQFRKSGRARLVGVATRGAFMAGKSFFTEPETAYFMMLPVAEYRLDGRVIEGVGVDPDVAVAFPADPPAAPGQDPQLGRALELAAGLAARLDDRP